MAANFGYVKIKRDRKDASVSVDGGFADKIEKALAGFHARQLSLAKEMGIQVPAR